MAKIVGSQTSFVGGIGDSEKSGGKNTFSFSAAIDHRTDPTQAVMTPRANLDSGSIVEDLVMWGERSCTDLWFYDRSGNIYKKNSSNTWSKEHTAASSSGNGLRFFGEDGNLYYTQDKTIGRLTRACEGDGSFNDGFIENEGGDPTNTKSLDLESSSSQYAYAADNASNSITGDLTIEAYIKPESLPASNTTMTLVSKWNENSQRSYKMDIATESNFFGDGSDGALTISTNTTESPIDSTASGTSGSYSLTATNASFAAGQKILIHQTRGTGAGTYELNEIQSYTAGTITTKNALSATYTTSGSDAAQVRVVKQHTTVTINSGITYTAKAWDGSVGGILAFFANSTVTITGNIVADGGDGDTDNPGLFGTVAGGTGGGFRGGATRLSQISTTMTAEAGEGTSGAAVAQYQANGSGGGGGYYSGVTSSTAFRGAAGGHASLGGYATLNPDQPDKNGEPGNTSGSANLSTMTFGGGGGGGVDLESSKRVSGGGAGGGIICIFGKTINEITGTVSANGGDAPQQAGDEGGAGGAGGSILIKCQTATLGTDKVTAYGGTAYRGPDQADAGTEVLTGSDGRIHIDYLTSYTGTTAPTIDAAQDESLGSADGYILRLLVSDDGSSSEIYSQTFNVSTDQWIRPAITWDSSSSTAKFYANGVLFGTQTGSMTSIYDGTANLAVGADYDSGGTAQNFYDGLIDDVRIWNDVRTATELANNNDRKLLGTEFNQIAYFEFEDDLTDSQSSGNNDLTGSGSPTYSDDVPFSGLTTRSDQDSDASNTSATGDTAAIATTISEDGEGSTTRQDFVPTRDPIKSIILNINTVGTGDWTVTVHDAFNREVATSTRVNGDLGTGFEEFIFDSEFSPTIGATYHFHVTSTVADGILVSSVNNDINTIYHSVHFQTLVDDEYHPMAQIVNKLAIGNGRYIATLEGGDIYDPMAITLPSGYRVRSLSYWREYLAIGVWRGTNITDYDEGYIFFWDGISTTYNYFISVPEGGINTLFGTRDVLYAIAGYNGDLLAYTGGGSAQKIKRIPKIEKDEYVEYAPGSMTMWRTLLRFGSDLNTDSSSIDKGVYSFGTLNRNYPHSLGFEHPLSLGRQTSSLVKTGMVFASGQSLYVGWQNSNSFGVDKISVTNNLNSDSTLEMLLTDLGKITHKEFPLILRADFEPLQTGQRVRVKYKSNRESNWKIGQWEDTVNARDVRLPIKERTNEIQVAVDLSLTTSSTETITLTGISLETEAEERARMA